jgi:hypothetical protein
MQRLSFFRLLPRFVLVGLGAATAPAQREPDLTLFHLRNEKPTCRLNGCPHNVVRLPDEAFRINSVDVVPKSGKRPDEPVRQVLVELDLFTV